MTAEPEWTGRESNTAEYLRLTREGTLAQRAQALIAENRRLLDELRNPTGDGHRYGHASEDEITAAQDARRSHIKEARRQLGDWEPDGMEESC